MFTLDTNEQIEIRDIVKIELDQADTLLYWNRNDEDENATSHRFTFDEYYDRESGDYNAYTLKEGEYLYYTNAKKINMAYYGAGSIIVKSDGTPDLIKYNTNGIISAEDIAINGVEAIPWVTFKLDKTKKISVVENQYITLTEGDTFFGATDGEQQSNLGMILDNGWKKITGASYKFAESEADEDLPEVLVDGITWQARTRLDFNLSPTSPQTLHKKDSITLYDDARNEIETISPQQSTQPTEYAPIAVYANYACQYANHELISPVDDLKLKVIRLDDPVIDPDASGSESHTVSLDNYTNGDERYTKFSFESLKKNPPEGAAFKLKINIPSADEYGLIMFYNIDDMLGEAGHTPA